MNAIGMVVGLVVLAAPPVSGKATPVPTAAPAARVLTLDDVVKTAEANSPSLRTSAAQSDAADARAGEARAPLLPQISAAALLSGHTNNSAVPVAIAAPSPVPVSYALFPSSSADAALTGSQVILDVGSVERWRAAIANAAASGSTELAERLTVRLSARLAFFTVRANQELVRVATESLDNQQKHLTTVEAFVKVGNRPEIDLAQSRGDTANARLALIRAQNNFETAKAELNQTMGVTGSTDFDVSSETLPPVTNEDDDLNALMPEALRARPEIQSADASLRASGLSLDAAHASYLPTISVLGRLDEGGNYFGNTAPNLTGTVNANWSIFAGFLTRSQVHEARASVVSSQAERDSVLLQVRLDLDRARLAVRAAKAEQGAADDVLFNANERLRLAEGRYAAGSGSILELADAQLARTQAAAQKVQADFDLASARAQLLQALGRTS